MSTTNNMPETTQQTTFSRAFQIQMRVVSALLRRELIALSGKKGIGFLLMLVEPLIFVSAICVFFYLTRRTVGNVPVVAFAMSGYCVMWGCRFQMMKMMNVVAANRSLLYHRYVKIFDLMLGRSILQICSTSISFLMFAPIIYIGLVDFPVKPYLVVFSWLAVLWYGWSLGLITSSIYGLVKMGEKICIVIMVLHIWITGAFMMVEWLPPDYRGYYLLFPMVHATEMMRDGLFGNRVTAHYSVLYMVCANMVLTYLGLVLVRKLSQRGAMDDSD
ncbi:MAG: ABC transporter permease [Desulfovibrionaceae bacterium]|nr:ABC transporter permease [Desulfovibrionaceae bacterium]